MSENGDIYVAGNNFTLPPAVTAVTNLTSAITEVHLTLTLLEVSEKYCFSLLSIFKYLGIKLPPVFFLLQKGA